MLVLEDSKKPILRFFHLIAPIFHRFAILTFKGMCLRVSHLNELFVTMKVLFSFGINIKDGCQSWPLIAAYDCLCYTINYFERNCTTINMTN